MRAHYDLLLKKFDLPAQAETALTDAGNILFGSHEAALSALISKFYRLRFRLELLEDDLNQLAEKSGVPLFTVCFVFVAAASKFILEDYGRAGLSEALFWDTIMDLRYKLMECRTVKKIWGTFVLFWYPIFFSLDLFKLGRLEFERQRYDGRAYRCGGIEINPGDTVYSVHIPSCGPLTRELRMDSYRRAYEFFAEERQGKPLICICHSWLLYPSNRDIFPPHLNTVDFMNDWNIVETEVFEAFGDAWRVFGMDFDPALVPQETAQQKALHSWITAGNKTGAGLGILVFDGEKIIRAQE